VSRVFVGVYALLVIGPLSLVVLNSLRTTSEIYSTPVGWPSSEGLNNYALAWSQASFSTYVFNSLLVTLSSLTIGISVAALASFPLGVESSRDATCLLRCS
jgi:raffinose/stachyose/melibiose transport system permease protein